MRKLITLLLTAFTLVVANAQDLSDLKFGTDTTFDVITWNIEHFPQAGVTTVDDVKNIIKNLNVEVIAIQEIEDTAAFTKMVNELEGYDGFYGNWYYIACGYIYKSDVVTVNNKEELFHGDFKIFPRPAYLFDVNYNGERFYILNNHFKCCSGSEDRRSAACAQLKEYIDNNLPDENVIVLGDLNDEIVDSINVFQNFIDDKENFFFADMAVAQSDSEYWSYESWPSHLDHILITNELFEHTPNATTIQLDDYFSPTSYYKDSISDHLPVGINISLSAPLHVYSNFFATKMIVDLPANHQSGTLSVSDSSNKLLYTVSLTGQQDKIKFKTKSFPQGILTIEFKTTGLPYKCEVLHQ